jgi:hypothetical protein
MVGNPGRYMSIAKGLAVEREPRIRIIRKYFLRVITKAKREEKVRLPRRLPRCQRGRSVDPFVKPTPMVRGATGNGVADFRAVSGKTAQKRGWHRRSQV